MFWRLTNDLNVCVCVTLCTADEESLKIRIRESFLMGEGTIDLLLDPHDYLGIETHLWVFNDMILCTNLQKEGQQRLRWKCDLLNCTVEFRMYQVLVESRAMSYELFRQAVALIEWLIGHAFGV
jgi:hypothetical protein